MSIFCALGKITSTQGGTLVEVSYLVLIINFVQLLPRTGENVKNHTVEQNYLKHTRLGRGGNSVCVYVCI